MLCRHLDIRDEPMLALGDLTLCCIDTANQALALRALRRSMRHATFARVLFITDRPRAEAGIDVVSGITIADRAGYSEFVVKRLGEYVSTPHLLLIQWDGFIVNPDAWRPAFLDFDYIGAKWHWHRDGMNVGNGGFSLRSRRLLSALHDPSIVVEGNEDELICRRHRPLLEARYGIRFAPEAMADRFSFEADYPAGTPFGFHGLFNFWRTIAPEELPSLCAEMSDAIARSPQLEQLARNYANLGRWCEASVVLERICSSTARPDLLALWEQARGNAARMPVARRNDPCPCGSGKRYKHCHGAAAAADVAPRPPDQARAAGQARAPIQAGQPALAILERRESAAGAPGASPTPEAAGTAAQELGHALALHQQGRLDDAERLYRQVLETSAHPLAEHYLGVIHYQRGRLELALPLLRQSTARAPQVPDFHLNLGVALLAAGDEQGAVAEIRQSLAQKPDNAGALNSLGLALQGLNRLPEAIAAFREAIRLVPAHAEAHWNLALALLLTGATAEGWREYEWRLRIPALAGREAAMPIPRWDGRARAGQRLLLRVEQGLGDIIQFVRFVPALARAGMRITLESPRELRRLLATVDGVERVVDRGEPGGAHDVQIHLMSLPSVLAFDAAADPVAIAARVPYVEVSADAISRWREHLGARRRGIDVGIVWAGSKAHRNDRNRSCRLDDLLPLAEVPGVSLVSLQVGQMTDGLEDCIARGIVRSFAEEIDDFVDTAALIGALDVVVTVDTSVAHLAGAMGKPVIVMLPFAPDWRWGLASEHTPWYPTATLVRQTEPRAWAPVVSRVAELLAARSAAAMTADHSSAPPSEAGPSERAAS